MIKIKYNIISEVIGKGEVTTDSLTRKISDIIGDEEQFLKKLSSREISFDTNKSEGQRVYIEDEKGDLHYNKFCVLIESLCTREKLRNIDLKNKTVAQKLAISRECKNIEDQCKRILSQEFGVCIITTDLYVISQDYCYSTLPCLSLLGDEQLKTIFSCYSVDNIIIDELKKNSSLNYTRINFSNLHNYKIDHDRLRTLISNRKALLTGMSILDNMFVQERSYDMNGLIGSIQFTMSYLTSLASLYPDNGDKIRRSEFVNSFSSLLTLAVKNNDSIQTDFRSDVIVDNIRERILIDSNSSTYKLCYSTLTDLDITIMILKNQNLNVQVNSNSIKIEDSVTGEYMILNNQDNNDGYIKLLSTLNYDQRKVLKECLILLLLISIKALVVRRTDKGLLAASINSNVVKEVLYNVK